jgi:beta-galactosidase
MHQATAGYHRMFFERNIPVDVVSARELSVEKLRQYKLVIVPYPLMLTRQEADALRQYVSDGGHLFSEARPGWVDERGHAEPIIPGFGWHEMFGVREKRLIPGKEFQVRWNNASFATMGFLEEFDTLRATVRPVAFAEDGTPIGYENRYGRGSAIVFGSFAGQENQQKSVAMHPLGTILAEWAGLSEPKLKAPALVELRQMSSPQGRLVLFFNHSNKASDVDFQCPLEKSARSITELLTAQKIQAVGARFDVKAVIPADGVRVYRIDY